MQGKSGLANIHAIGIFFNYTSSFPLLVPFLSGEKLRERFALLEFELYFFQVSLFS